MTVEIKHNAEKRKFYTIINNIECHLLYTKKGPTMLEYHLVYVPIPLRGQAIASQITEEALHYAKKNNFQVIPSCSFVDWYISKHHEYEKNRVQDLDEIS